jgi:hypothetical protein
MSGADRHADRDFAARRAEARARSKFATFAQACPTQEHSPEQNQGGVRAYPTSLSVYGIRSGAADQGVPRRVRGWCECAASSGHPLDPDAAFQPGEHVKRRICVLFGVNGCTTVAWTRRRGGRELGRHGRRQLSAPGRRRTRRRRLGGR